MSLIGMPASLEICAAWKTESWNSERPKAPPLGPMWMTTWFSA